MKLPTAPQRDGLNLSENFLLFTLNDSGKILVQRQALDLIVAGSTLADLARREVVSVSDDKKLLVVSEPADTLESPLGEVHSTLVAASEPQSVKHWINALSTEGLVEKYLHALEERGRLEIKTTKFLGRTSKTKYLRTKMAEALDLNVIMRETLYDDRKMDLLTGPLIYLMYISGVLGYRHPDIRTKQVNELMQSDKMPYLTEISDNVYQILQITGETVQTNASDD